MIEVANYVKRCKEELKRQDKTIYTFYDEFLSTVPLRVRE